MRAFAGVLAMGITYLILAHATELSLAVSQLLR